MLREESSLLMLDEALSSGTLVPPGDQDRRLGCPIAPRHGMRDRQIEC